MQSVPFQDYLYHVLFAWHFSRSFSLQVFNEMFKGHMSEPEVLAMLSHSQEFEQVKVRN